MTRARPRPIRPAALAVLAAAMTCPLAVGSAQAAAAPEAGTGTVSAPGTAPQRIKDQFIVTFRSATPEAEVNAAREDSRDRGAKVRYTYRHALKGFAATMTEAQAERLRNNPRVQAVEPDYEVHASDITQTGAVWGLDRIDQKALPLSGSYTYGTDGTGVTAYVIDTGIRTSHSQFGGRATAGFTAINDGQGANDCNGHGTHVAGTVGGSTYGVAKGVKLVAVRVLDCAGSGSNSGVIAGVDWVTASRSGPSVANMSLGGGASSALDTAVANSIAAGVTYAVAAGNDNANACSYSPARLGAALTVGASTSGDARASFSNYGSCLDLFAPGEGIRSSVHTSDTATASYSGTSMASPHVAGVVATYLQAAPAATSAEVREALVGGATPDLLSGVGTGSPNQLLYAPRAAATPPPPPPPPPTSDAPVATAPVVELSAAGGRLATSTVTVRVSWSASDADGVAGYQLQRSTDGGATWTTVSLPSPGATSVTLNQAAATALRYRVRATDITGLTGGYASGATTALRLLQQNHTSVSYPSGSWTTYSNSSASGGSYRQARAAGSRVRLSFTGSQVQWVGTPATNRGRAEVFLDGVSRGVVDMYASSPQYRRILFSGSTTPGAHTLEVRVLGTRSPSSSSTYVDADAFVTVG